jgi:hypothetical protein
MIPAAASTMLATTTATPITSEPPMTLGLASDAHPDNSSVVARSDDTTTCSHGPGLAIPWMPNAAMIATSSRP